MNPSVPVPFLPLPFLRREIDHAVRADGAVLLSSRVPLGEVAPHLPHLLREQARLRPEHPWLMRRAAQGWEALRYGEARSCVDAMTQWLLDAAPRGRCVMVLSGNSPEHAVFELAAMQAGMPYVPVTPAYSLLSADHAKLREMVARVRPAVILVQSARTFERALRALDLAEVRVLTVTDPVEGLPLVAWSRAVATPPTVAVEAAVSRLDHDTVGKYLFTSGSTGVPKVVPVTQRMLCVSTAMHAATVGFDAAAPSSVLLEWLPWSHVAGGTAIFNSVLHDGGTLYLDDGRPVPGEFDRTLRNLRDVSPTRFSSVPAGYAMLADALERDATLGEAFFRRLRRLTSSGAKLPDSIYQRMQDLAVRHLGARVPFVAGYGSTETCAATTVVHWPVERAGLVGLPQPGVKLKLVPLDGARYEVRVQGPTVMQGYLDQPELDGLAFDEEGWYRMGDAVTFVDPDHPEEGLAFAGRVAEEFKLQSGIFVRAGSLRVELVSALAPLVSDVVVAGPDRPHLGLLIWLNPAACRARYGDLSLESLCVHPELKATLRDTLRAHNAAHPASSLRVVRALLLADPPSMDAGEITDKGYVNQRAVLERRAAQVDALYDTVAPACAIDLID